ncbi:hypothetical protein ACH5RR_036184 [Cinchona calisaya]|uniref:BHLH domain-containing protein n=1 Tax=Cinchona calisaya TaxID=153742 RepID=A0ABD2Y6D5_9GENT
MENNFKLSISAPMLMNSSMDVISNNLTELDHTFHPSLQDLLSLTIHEGFSDNHHQRSEIPFPFTNNDSSNNPNASHHLQVPVNLDSVAHFFPQWGGPIPILSESDCLVNSSTRAAGLLVNNKTNETDHNYGKKKRKRNNNREMEKPREVVHVRAKRGQATDSHSLAERLRREKINEKLRCLQDLVPGCYKTMGMAVMLDVIINYVRSLQNQIDFLSMKLSAASLFYDFNSLDMDAMGTMQLNGFLNDEGNSAAQLLFALNHEIGCVKDEYHPSCIFISTKLFLCVLLFQELLLALEVGTSIGKHTITCFVRYNEQENQGLKEPKYTFVKAYIDQDLLPPVLEVKNTKITEAGSKHVEVVEATEFVSPEAPKNAGLPSRLPPPSTKKHRAAYHEQPTTSKKNHSN